MIERISAAVMPAVLLLCALPMLSRRRDYFAVFTAGAREGLESAVRLLPAMTALSVGLSMLRASGAMEFLAERIAVPAAALGIPAELLPLILARPISGSASTAAFADLLAACGADSFPALCASVLMASSDTLIYIVSVYFSAVPAVRRTRYAVPAAAAVMLLCIFLSCAAARICV